MLMVLVELDKANNVIRQAKESSQKALSKQEIEDMLEKAREVLSGATVQTSSITLDEYTN
jgi:hypothetical protein